MARHSLIDVDQNRVKVENYHDDYFPAVGLSICFLKNALDLDEFDTMYDVEQYILELTSGYNKCSFAELVRAKYPKAVSKKAEFFVSFAFSTKPCELFSALDEHRIRLGRKDITVWISLFSINQHFNETDENGKKAFPSGWFKNTFSKKIPLFDNTLFVASPLERPKALNRIWCIFEVYVTLINKCNLEIVLSKSDEEQLEDMILNDNENIINYFASVRAESAEARNPKDFKRIAEFIKSNLNGFDALNEALRERFREWFTHYAIKAIDAEKARNGNKNKRELSVLLNQVATTLEDMVLTQKLYGDESREIAKRMANLSQLYARTGNLGDAETLARRALEIDKKQYGEVHHIVASDMTTLADLLKLKQHGYKEAEQLYKKAIKMKQQTLDKMDPSLARTYNNYADLLRTMGRPEEAEPLIRKAIQIDKRNGSNTLVYATDLNNLAAILQEQLEEGEDDEETLEEVAALYEESLEIYRNVLGRNSSEAATTLANLANVYCRVNQLDEAINLMREAVQIDERTIGKNHMDYARDVNSLALLLKEKGDLFEAKQLGLVAIKVAGKTLGKDHERTKRYRKIWGVVEESDIDNTV